MRFSIITPSYNSLQWLPLAAASVADQAGVELEHLVQDGASTDGTPAWLAQQPRLRSEVAPDTGMYQAVNRGLRRATGEILAYLNCDEQYLPGTLAAVAEWFAQHPEAEVCFGDVVVVDGDGDYLCHRRVVLPTLGHVALGKALGTFTAATFFRRSILEKGFFFDESWRALADAEWIWRMGQARVRWGLLRRMASVFTETGANLSQQPQALAETARLEALAPAAWRPWAWWIRARYWVRKLLAGSYTVPPFGYAIYTRAQPGARQDFYAARPTGRYVRVHPAKVGRAGHASR